MINLRLFQTWFNIPDYISVNKYRVKNLKPGFSYSFIIRAENEKGIGAPSQPSPLTTTLKEKSAGRNSKLALIIVFLGDSFQQEEEDLALKRISSEQLIKLEEVKTINSTAVRLFWKRKKVEDLIDGYYIKWKGPPRSNINQ